MAKKDELVVTDEKEKAAIEWENKMLFIFMPSVGLIAFLLGLIGFILALGGDEATYPNKIPIAIFLIILAVLGLGGIAYGVVQFLKKRRSKYKKEIKEPDQQ